MSTFRLEYWRRRLESKTFLICAFILMRLALEAGYIWLVSPIFSHAGFAWAPDLLKYIESWILFGLLLALAPVRIQKPSDYMVTILIAGLLLPVLSFYALAGQTREHLYIILLGYGMILLFRRGQALDLPLVKNGMQFALGISIVMVMIVSVWMVVSGGIRYFNLDLTQVYEFRHESEELTGRFGFQYMNVWAWKVFGPLLMVIGLWKRWWWLVAATIALHVLWFGISARKAVLFYPAVILVVWLWVRRIPATGLVPLAISIVVLAALGVYLIFDQLLWGSLFIRRVFYVIANNSFAYYEFFSQNPKVWWSNSVLSRFVEYPYDAPTALVIGQWQGTMAWVNNSFISTGFMHAGVFGVMLYGVLVGLLFRLIDSFSHKGVPVWMSVAVMIVPMRSLLISADLPTALLTHGIGVALIMLMILRSRKFKREMSRKPKQVQVRPRIRFVISK